MDLKNRARGPRAESRASVATMAANGSWGHSDGPKPGNRCWHQPASAGVGLVFS